MKGQFFVLTAVFIVSLLFALSVWLQPWKKARVEEVAMAEEVFIFNNLLEKADETVKNAKSMEELKYNLDEYVNFVKQYLLTYGYEFELHHSIFSAPAELPGVVAMVCLTLKSPILTLQGTRSVTWS